MLPKQQCTLSWRGNEGWTEQASALLLPPPRRPSAEQCIVEAERAAAAGPAAPGSRAVELSEVLTVPTRGRRTCSGPQVLVCRPPSVCPSVCLSLLTLGRSGWRKAWCSLQVHQHLAFSPGVRKGSREETGEDRMKRPFSSAHLCVLELLLSVSGGREGECPSPQSRPICPVRISAFVLPRRC